MYLGPPGGHAHTKMANWTPNEVLAVVTEMQEAVAAQAVQRAADPDRFTQALRSRHSAFAAKHPALFAKAAAPMSASDWETLRQLLGALLSVQENRLSQHDGSVQVGQVLVDKYVRPGAGDPRGS